jgi:hypothetical protein
MAELNNTGTPHMADSKEAVGETGCKFLFDAGPIASMQFEPDGDYCKVTLEIRSVVGGLDTYYVMTTGWQLSSISCPFIPTPTELQTGPNYCEWADGEPEPILIWVLTYLQAGDYS